VRYGSHGSSFLDNAWYAQLQKDTNIKVNWDVRWNADFTEQKALMFASGDIPEAIFGSAGFTYNDIVNNLEYFLPLENLIDQYMPNLKKIMAEHPDVKQAITYLDGHIYSLPKKIPGRPVSNTGHFINKVWLDKLGLQIPQTVEELYQVMKAFKTQDANGNGIADEIPLFLTAGDATAFNFGLTQMHGAMAEWQVDPATKKIRYMPVTEEFHQGLQWASRLYAEGLLNPEYFTMTGDQAAAKGAVTDPQVFGFMLDWTPDATIQGNSKDFIVIEPPAAPDGKRYAEWLGESIRQQEFMITTKCKNPEVVARWADQFYTPDATIQNTWGAFGETTRKEADGSYTLLPLSATPDFLDLGQDTRKWWRSSADCGPGYAPDGLKYNLDETSGDGYKLTIDKYAAPYVDINRHLPPNMWETQAESAEKARIRTDLNNYMVQATSNWIAKGSVTDAEWNTYVNWLNSHGLPRFIELQQQIYDRFTK
jgi:putative aldouronate transport system substrate-binding protein